MKESQNIIKKRPPLPSALSSPQEDQEELREKIQKLNYLCTRYDPYKKDIPEDILQILLEFNLDPQVHNPFTLTENLLVLLDQFTNLAKKLS